MAITHRMKTPSHAAINSCGRKSRDQSWYQTFTKSHPELYTRNEPSPKHAETAYSWEMVRAREPAPKRLETAYIAGR